MTNMAVTFQHKPRPQQSDTHVMRSCAGGCRSATPCEECEKKQNETADVAIDPSLGHDFRKMSILAFDRQGHAQGGGGGGGGGGGAGGGPPAPALDSCDATKTPVVNSAVTTARTWMDAAEPKVAAFAAGTASAADRAVVSGALTSNFHTTAAADVTTIAANFSTLHTHLNGALDLECVSSWWCDDNMLAYVRGRFAWVRRLGDVNLCPLFFGCGNGLLRPTTVIHEVSHQYPGTEDKAYEDAAAYTTLSPADAMDNAASYATTARQIFFGGAHGPGETC